MSRQASIQIPQGTNQKLSQLSLNYQSSKHIDSKNIADQSFQSKHQAHKHNRHSKEMNYKPLEIPCDLDLAQKHAQARKVGVEKELPEDQIHYCPCCAYQIERNELPYDCDPQELRFLGSGFPLFYNFIKFCIFILFQFWLLKGMFCLATDLMGDYCIKHSQIREHAPKHLSPHFKNPQSDIVKCGGSFWHYMSLANIYDLISRPDLREFQCNLTLIVVVVNMITLIFFRKAQRKIDIEIDESQLTPSDYTIAVKNIPIGDGIDYKVELQKLFTTYAVVGKTLEVTKIVLVYDIEEIIELEELLKEIIKKKQSILEKNKMDLTDHEVKKIDEEIEEIEKQIHHKEHEIMKDPLKFAGTAFISFQTEDMKESVLEQNQSNWIDRMKVFFANGKVVNTQGDELVLNGNQLFCEQAPEPNDVDWEFVHIKTKTKINARIKAWSISIAFMTACFFLIWGLTELGDAVNEKAEDMEREGEKSVIMTFFASFISQSIAWTIIFFNKFIIGKVYHLIVDCEKISNKTKFNISFAKKQSMALFINTALISLVVDFFITGNIIGKGGFIFNETNVFLLNAFIPPIVWFIDPWSIQFDFRRNKQLRYGRNCVLTQQEANEMMEMPDYSSAKRYGDIMKTMWFTFFYGDIIPVGILFSILGLVLYYFIDKFNVLRRRTIKENLSKDLSIEMILFLEFIVLLSGVGNLTISWTLFKEIHWQDVTIIIVSIIYSLLPNEQISQILFPFKSKSEEKFYSEAQNEFITDYDLENPVTKKEVLKKRYQ